MSAPAPSYRRKPVSMAGMDPGLRRGDEYPGEIGVSEIGEIGEIGVRVDLAESGVRRVQRKGTSQIHSDSNFPSANFPNFHSDPNFLNFPNFPPGLRRGDEYPGTVNRLSLDWLTSANALPHRWGEAGGRN